MGLFHPKFPCSRLALIKFLVLRQENHCTQKGVKLWHLLQRGSGLKVSTLDSGSSEPGFTITNLYRLGGERERYCESTDHEATMRPKPRELY